MLWHNRDIFMYTILRMIYWMAFHYFFSFFINDLFSQEEKILDWSRNGIGDSKIVVGLKRGENPRLALVNSCTL
uniref:Uncharacterized protein n=1 Tax=Tanacetum cinerariifolium TaxID=118510 RepID=A0A6L2P3W6_TANCI|nr:hypothetical protein [Tanacetum cinerariifolium]